MTTVQHYNKQQTMSVCQAAHPTYQLDFSSYLDSEFTAGMLRETRLVLHIPSSS